MRLGPRADGCETTAYISLVPLDVLWPESGGVDIELT